MKLGYGKALRSLAIALFSLSLAQGIQAAGASVYEGMISAALAKPTTAEKLDALNGLAAVMSNLDAETAKEINPEFTSAITAVYNEAHEAKELHPALHKMLTNAAGSVVLDEGQKATVNEWANEIKSTAAASTASPANANAMQQLATAGNVILGKINALNQEVDESKRLEGIYNLLQEAHGKTFDANVQEEFGKLVVKTFNNGTEIHSYLTQVLHEISENKTPLLADPQIEYVTKEMLPKLAAAPAAAQEEEKADKKKKGKKKKGLKKGKKAGRDKGEKADKEPGKKKKAKKGKKAAAAGEDRKEGEAEAKESKKKKDKKAPKEAGKAKKGKKKKSLKKNKKDRKAAETPEA